MLKGAVPAIAIPGYRISEVIHIGHKTIVYRGRQEKNHTPVVIKVSSSQYPQFRDLVSLRNQFAIAQQLEHPNIIKCYSLESYNNGYALILEDFQGITLSNYANSQPLSLQEFLPIGIAITEALDFLYQKKIIHKDIKPKNLLINPETKQIKIIDFSISSLLPKETTEIKNPNVLEGTLAYMSPEQTGRMNRGIDYRTDFYSLGVTFYELLTGQLPFNSNNSLELVHCHLAQEPINPREINPQIPEIVAEIILKLMAKTAENRYQTAKGIKHDLEMCQQMLLNQGEISSFRLAARDKSDRFLIPEKLYGRETEVANLLNAFENVSQGSKELILVAGFSGIGKTAVVHEIHKPVVRQKGYFISGKYDQFQRNIPFSAFVQAFSNLIKQLLTESANQLQDWKNKILSVLGEQAGVIIDVIPELEKIIGQQPKAPEFTANAAQNLFNLLFGKFIQILATPEHPLVIFLDDLQWADAASLKLIQLLMKETDIKYLLLICAYRDNEVSSVHPFMMALDSIRQTPAIINQITLKPLDECDLNHLIADTLSCPELNASTLTQLVIGKTQGNPFFTNQLLKSLYESGFIKFNYDTGYWHYDINQAQSLYLNSDIVDFLKLQLQKLPENTQNILKVAACIGNQFDLETLSIVSEKKQTEASADLWAALKEELILPRNEVYRLFTNEHLEFSNTNTLSALPSQLKEEDSEQIKVKYKFLHDRVQQAAYSLIPEADKQATHLKIGRLILKNTPSAELEENIFEIVNQLNMGIDLITDQLEKYRLANLNLVASRKAKSATAYEAAGKYLSVGLELLAKNSWQTQYNLTLNLYLEAAEVEYLSGSFEKALELSNLALQQVKQILDQVKVYKIQIQAYIGQNLQKEAVQIGVRVLKKLGVKLPKKATESHVALAVLQTKLTLFGKRMEDLLSLPRMTDPYKLAAMQILSILAPAASQAGSAYFSLAILAIVRLSVQYGNSAFTTFGYALYAGILTDKLDEIVIGYKFGKLAIDLLNKINSNSFRCKVYFMFNTMVRHFLEPVQKIIPHLEENVQIGLETGDIEFGSYSCWTLGSFLLLSGQNLELVEQKTLKYVEITANLKLKAPALALNIIRQTIFNLQGRAYTQATLLIGEAFNEVEMIANLRDNPFCLSLFYSNKTFLNYLFSNYTEIIRTAPLIEEYHQSDPGFFHYCCANYYYSLALLAQCNYASPAEQKLYLQQVELNQKKMKIWAHHAPCNFKHKYDLIAAEQARVLGKNWQAAELYDQAIRGAKQNEYLQEEAIANELAAKFYLAWNKEKIAITYLIDAYYCYHNWGAKAKVENLEITYPHLLSSVLNPEKIKNITHQTNTLISHLTADSSTTSISVMLDLETVTKAALAISSEIHVDELIITLMQVILENVGAETASLILQKQDIMMLAAQCYSYQQCELQSIPLSNIDSLPLSLINYVSNTREDVLIDDATTESSFATDPYIIRHQPKSILCTPIINQGQLIGIFYLENTLTVGAFTPERLKILKLLSSQAAISLENAQLYTSLEEKVAVRTRELHENNLQLQATLNELKLTQTQLIQTEKMSSLGQMVAGVAHEINNPVNFIYANIEPANEYFRDLLRILNLYQQEYPNPTAIIRETIEEIDLDFLTQDLHKILDSMHLGADRIRKIVLGLRNFSRLDEADMKPVDIHEGIDNTLMLLQPRFKEKLGKSENIVVKNYGKLPLVDCYASQLNQVFMNILSNAIDALSKREPELPCTVRENNCSQITICTQLLNQDWVRIAIQDNGLGMSEEVKKRIFDPFFTTKKVGEGTGLGLSISYQIIVDKHRGKIECISQPGKGTEFLIDIPLKQK
ncbi:MAG TPA: AAA family ATPase [Nostocaceae cyanobacterium]|nr:AAA family ATPase [Nostocaceae cyanobacterium]